MKLRQDQTESLGRVIVYSSTLHVYVSEDSRWLADSGSLAFSKRRDFLDLSIASLLSSDESNSRCIVSRVERGRARLTSATTTASSDFD